MNSETPSDLCFAAIIMWHFQRMELKEAVQAAEITKEEQALRIERFRAELMRVVGDRQDIQIKINGGCVEATVEGLSFLAYEFTSPRTKEISTAVSLIGRCPSCGVETMSRPFVDYAGLGEMLAEFEPACEHFCPTRQKGNSGEKKGGQLKPRSSSTQRC